MILVCWVWYLLGGLRKFLTPWGSIRCKSCCLCRFRPRCWEPGSPQTTAQPRNSLGLSLFSGMRLFSCSIHRLSRSPRCRRTPQLCISLPFYAWWRWRRGEQWQLGLSMIFWYHLCTENRQMLCSKPDYHPRGRLQQNDLFFGFAAFLNHCLVCDLRREELPYRLWIRQLCYRRRWHKRYLASWSRPRWR